MNKTLRITDLIIIILFISHLWERFMDTAGIGDLVIATDVIYVLAILLMVFPWNVNGTKYLDRIKPYLTV